MVEARLIMQVWVRRGHIGLCTNIKSIPRNRLNAAIRHKSYRVKCKENLGFEDRKTWYLKNHSLLLDQQ